MPTLESLPFGIHPNRVSPGCRLIALGLVAVGFSLAPLIIGLQLRSYNSITPTLKTSMWQGAIAGGAMLIAFLGMTGAAIFLLVKFDFPLRWRLIALGSGTAAVVLALIVVFSSAGSLISATNKMEIPLEPDGTAATPCSGSYYPCDPAQQVLKEKSDLHEYGAQLIALPCIVVLLVGLNCVCSNPYWRHVGDTTATVTDPYGNVVGHETVPILQEEETSPLLAPLGNAILR